MASYYQVVRRLPAPSDAQISNFIDYVASAHSWYKWIPVVPQGIPFYFYLDPNSGCERVFERGKPVYRERNNTAEHRDRCGYLQYSREAAAACIIYQSRGSSVISSSRRPVSATREGRIWTRCLRLFRSHVRTRPQGEGKVPPKLAGVLEDREAEESSGSAIQSEEYRISVPDEVLRAGHAELTGMIHPLASGIGMWMWIAGKPLMVEGIQRWPAGTPGAETVLEILRFVRENPQVTGRTVGYCPEIDRLVDPERQRMRKLAEQAIHRMLDLVYGSSRV